MSINDVAANNDTAMPVMTTLESAVSTRQDGTVVQLIGDAGVRNADALGRYLLPVSASHPVLVVFDWSQLTFISSLGIGMIIEFQRGMARRGGVVRLASPQPLVRDMLVKCRIDQVLPIFDSVEDALASKV